MASVSLPLLPFVDIANFPLPCVSPGEFPGLAVSEATPVVITSKPPLPLAEDQPHGRVPDTSLPCLHLQSIPSHRIQNGADILQLPNRGPNPPSSAVRPIHRRVLQPYNPLGATNHSADPPALRPQVRGEARDLFSDPNPFAALYPRRCHGPPGTPPRPSQSAQARSTKFTSIIKCL